MIRIATDKGRFYVGEDFVYPSVTTIIDSEESDALYFWKKKVGEEEAERIGNRSKNRGTIMHNHIETFFFKDCHKINLNEYTEDEIQVGNLLFEKMQTFFDLVDEPLKTENFINHSILERQGYCGAYDFEAIIEGQLKIIDFKSASKIKQKKYITGYYEQLSAYCHAYYTMYKEFPLAEIWVSPEVGNPQRFVLTKKDLKEHYAIFLKKLKMFYDKNKSFITNIINQHKNNSLV